MAKLLHLSRPSRRLSNVLRGWLAMRRQKRRRAAGAGAGGGVPNAPSGMWLQDRGDNIFVQWDINSADHWGFRIYRLGTGLVGTGGPLSTEFADYGVETGNYYAYYVVAYNGAGESAQSNLDGLDFGV